MLAHILKLMIVIQVLIAFAVFNWLRIPPAWSTGLAVLVALAAALAFNATLITVEFLLSSRYASPLPPALKARKPNILLTWLRELRDAFFVFNVRQPFLGNRLLASAPAPGREGLLPVLFIHGYFCNRAVWRPFARFLAQRGHVVGSVNLEPVYGSIDDYADIIERAVVELCERTGHDQVALVAHSMGGLAARAYLRAHGDLAVAKVITLGTPHRGTLFGRLAAGRNARQMRLNSDWLATLAASESAERRRLFTIFFSHQDNIVVPQAIQVLPDAKIVELVGIGHISLAIDPAVHQQVAEQLTDRVRVGTVA